MFKLVIDSVCLFSVVVVTTVDVTIVAAGTGMTVGIEIVDAVVTVVTGGETVGAVAVVVVARVVIVVDVGVAVGVAVEVVTDIEGGTRVATVRSHRHLSRSFTRTHLFLLSLTGVGKLGF